MIREEIKWIVGESDRKNIEASGGRLSQFFCNLYSFFYLREEKIYEERDLYYAFAEIPPYWQIFPFGENGKIESNGVVKGVIYVKGPHIERFVDRVAWLDQAGKECRIQYYNEYGFPYCDRILDAGVPVLDIYYTEDKKELFAVNLSNGVVVLYRSNCVSGLIDSKEDFKKKIVNLAEENLAAQGVMKKF